MNPGEIIHLTVSSVKTRRDRLKLLTFKAVCDEESFAWTNRFAKIGDEVVCRVIEYHQDTNWWKVDVITNLSEKQRRIKKQEKKIARAEKKAMKAREDAERRVTWLSSYNRIFKSDGQVLDESVQFQSKVVEAYHRDDSHHYYLIDSGDGEILYGDYCPSKILNNSATVLCKGKIYVPEVGCYRTTILHSDMPKSKVITDSKKVHERTLKKKRKNWREHLSGIQIRHCKRPGRCSCCGKPFDEDNGYKVAKRDVFLCEACHSAIRPKRGASGLPRAHFISVPMGGQPKRR